MSSHKSISAKLSELATLPPNWSSYGSSPPSALSIENALTFLSSVKQECLPDFEIAPSLDGGVDLGYGKGYDWFSLVCHNDGTMMVETSDGIDKEDATFSDAMCAFRIINGGKC